MEIEARAAQSGAVFRSFPLVDVEFRDAGEDSADITFDGVASVVDTPYQVRDQWGEFTETIRSGAFSKTLKDSKADVALFVNHRHGDVPLATRSAGTLRLLADPNLRVGANLDPARPDVQIVRSAISRREMSQMSIGFSVPEARDSWNSDYTERTIHEVKLMEVSVVYQGANPKTLAAVRSFDELMTITADDMADDEIRRAIAHLESLRQAQIGAHEYVDANGDGLCDACGMTLEEHTAEMNPSGLTEPGRSADYADMLTRLWDLRLIA